MSHEHHYKATLQWTGAKVSPTTDYKAYSREYTITMEGKPALAGSADPTFRGDPAKHNPEDLLVASLSACHLLTYLALCSRNGVKVIAYEDHAEGTMAVKDGRMRITQVTLHPKVVIARDSDLARASELHHSAHDECFIANSVNFPVENEAQVVQAG
jgi:organic hydroperoxide reductase OsmC/OhrA